MKRTLIAEHGYDPVALPVLHTCDQKLDAHVQVYAFVPGGGLISDSRITAAEFKNVTFNARVGEVPGGHSK